VQAVCWWRGILPSAGAHWLLLRVGSLQISSGSVLGGVSGGKRTDQTLIIQQVAVILGPQ
jgi:hypothetical protein